MKKLYTEKDIVPGFVYINREASLKMRHLYINIVLQEINNDIVSTYWLFGYSEVYSGAQTTLHKSSIVVLLNDNAIEELLPLKP